MILALLLAAAPQTVAVLEFRDKVPAGQRIDAAYLSDQVRSAVKSLMPQARVITRENMLVLLQANGKDIASCEGECEVDTGRRIGADLVVSGELLKFGTQYKLNMKLHDTRSGELISGAVASGAAADNLDNDLRPAVGKLLAPLVQDQQPDPRAAPRQAEETPRRHGQKQVVFSLWGTLGYASVSSGSSSASGFAYGFGGQFFVHVTGPLYAGVLADYSFFPSPGSSRIDGVLAGGGLRFDLGEVALSGGAGYSDLSGGAGSGWGALGAIEYGILRLQLAWRHGSSAPVGLINALESSTNVVAAQAGLSITF